MTEQQPETAPETPVSSSQIDQESDQVVLDPPEGSERPGADPEDDRGQPFTPEQMVEIRQLREEIKSWRLKAQRSDQLQEALRSLAIRHHTASLLNDPDSLAWSDDLAGEDGLPDGQKIIQAAEALVASKPWLGRVRGRLPGMGEHSDTEAPLSLSQLLRG